MDFDHHFALIANLLHMAGAIAAEIVNLAISVNLTRIPTPSFKAIVLIIVVGVKVTENNRGSKIRAWVLMAVIAPMAVAVMAVVMEAIQATISMMVMP